MQNQRLSVALFLAVLTSCGESRTLSLAPPEAGGTQDTSPEAEARRLRMNVTVRVPDGAGTSEVTVSARTFTRVVVLQECVDMLYTGSDGVIQPIPSLCNAQAILTSDAASDEPPAFLSLPAPGTGACDIALCRMHAAICVANRALEISTSVSPTTLAVRGTITLGNTQIVGPAEVSVGPEDQESAVAFTEEAFHYAAWAATIAGENLRSLSTRPTPIGACGEDDMTATLSFPSGPTTTEYGTSFASSLVDATLLADEAARATVEHEKAVTEADFARVRDVAHASKLAWVDPDMSRARGAHVLVGGKWSDGLSDGVEPVFAEGVCPTAPPSPKAMQAVSLIRLAANKPSNVTDLAIPFEDLFEDALGGDASMQLRLAERLDDPSLLDPSVTASTFLASRGLTEADFIEARSYLLHESRAFVRSSAAVLPAQPMASERNPDGSWTERTTSFPLYAATATPPSPPPASQYRVMARYGKPTIASGLTTAALNDGLPTGATLPVIPSAAYARRGLIQLLDYAQSVARDTNGSSNPHDGARQVVASLATGLGGQVEGRLEACYKYETNRNIVRVRVYGYSDPNEFAIVDGNKGLRCAVEGNADGAPCGLEEPYTITRTTGPLYTTDAQSGFSKYAELILTATSTTTVYHVVRKRSDGATNSYEAIGGFKILADTGSPTGTYKYCTLVPINREVETLVAEVLTASPEACGEPATSCAGTDVWEHIPLESELSQDGDAYESSWRTHLARAKEAADRADLLGEQLIEAGLGMDLRMEDALEELGDICGGAVSIEGYFPQEGGTVFGGCTAANEGQPCATAGTICRATMCVLDPLAVIESKVSTDPAAQDLIDCIGDMAFEPYVALGDHDLCIWANGNSVCPDQTGLPQGHEPDPCPYLPSADGTCADPGYHAGTVQKTTHLSLFRLPDVKPLPAQAAPPCDALRELRRGEYDPAHLEEVRNGFFNAENVASYARRLGWKAGIDDRSTITFDGRPLYGTGDARAAEFPSGTWPCNVTVDPADCGSPSPDPLAVTLGCSFTSACGSGGNRTERAIMNQRLGRAVLAARVLTQVGVGPNFRGPYLPAPSCLALPAYAPSAALRTTKMGPTYAGFPLGGDIAWAGSADYVTSWYDTWWHTKKVQVGGELDCFVGTSGAIWSHDSGMLGELDGAVSTKTYDCADESGMMFKDYLPVLGSDTYGLVGRVWRGLDPMSPVASDDDLEGLVQTFLLHPELVGDAVLDPSDLGPYTRYWADDKCNTIAVAEDGLGAREILDAAELLCIVAEYDRSTLSPWDDLAPPSAESIEDLHLLESYLQYVGGEILRQAGEKVLVNVPRVALDALEQSGGFEGEMGAAAAEFAASLEEIRDYQTAVGTELQEFALDVAALRTELERNGIASALADVQMWSAVANQVAACGSSGMLNPKGIFFTCANAIAQIGFALAANELTEADLELVADLDWIAFQQKFLRHAEVLSQAGNGINAAELRQEAALTRIRGLQTRGRRDLAKVMMVGTDATGAQYNVNTVMRRRYNTLQKRYERAREDALRLAAIARKAIEQRLGVRLSEVTRSMALVEAPAVWVDTLCTLPALDYTRIRVENGLDVDNYADSYIGDYVRKLERVVQSYEFDYPFNDAADTAVVSLKNDVVRARDWCESSVPNLLAYSARLDVAEDPGETAVAGAATADAGVVDAGAPTASSPVWQAANCFAVTNVLIPDAGPGTPDGGSPQKEIRNCVDVMPLGEVANPPDVAGYRVTFDVGDASPSYTLDYYNDERDVSSALVQRVKLTSGYYRVSWYGRGIGEFPVLLPANAVTVRDAAGARAGVRETGVATTFERSPTFEAENPGGWARYFFIFRVASTGTYEIAVVPANVSYEHSVDLAGLMLEDASPSILGHPLYEIGSDYPPAAYIATLDAGQASQQACEDQDGDVYRTTWRRGCTRLCATGFDCDTGTLHCFWQTEFTITVGDIEQGGMLEQSGFAYGNFNYRIDGIALNLVGTGLKDCSTSLTPLTCYSSANVPYTLEHQPAYQVSNYDGEIYNAPLFIGRIEHGRGLAAERYLTNPLSSADRALLQDYVHYELRGRPLTGKYVLRLWEADGVYFPALEDIQVLLDYRYWTRFQ